VYDFFLSYRYGLEVKFTSVDSLCMGLQMSTASSKEYRNVRILQIL
jgi:hypothetical protein